METVFDIYSPNPLVDEVTWRASEDDDAPGIEQVQGSPELFQLGAEFANFDWLLGEADPGVNRIHDDALDTPILHASGSGTASVNTTGDTVQDNITVAAPVSEVQFTNRFGIPWVNLPEFSPPPPQYCSPSAPHIRCWYRCMKCCWIAYNASKPHGTRLSATEYAIDTGVVVPYVTLLNMHNCMIFRHKITVPCPVEGTVRFVVFTGDHGIPNQALRAIDHNLWYCGEIVVFRVANGRSWSSLVNLRGTLAEARLVVTAVKEVIRTKITNGFTSTTN